MWGIVPAAGSGTRLQPLAFSKELLPVGSRRDGASERPRAVSEYLLERMIMAGVSKICMVIAPGKSDIVSYYGGKIGGADVCYAVQPDAGGLCDAIFRGLPFLRDEDEVLVGLPDTVWFPVGGFRDLPRTGLSFLLFPVERPELFDAVDADAYGKITEIQVKAPSPRSRWIWGAFKVDGATLRALHSLWDSRGRRDAYVGTLVNAWLAVGGQAVAIKRGEAFVDVGTQHGYREALRLLDRVSL